MNKHHHHEPDDASVFKKRSLSQIQLKKTLEKVLKIILFIIALLMLAAVIFVYTIG